MASTFFGLNIAGSGLRAANAALNTTANNISNSDTEGYSRQKVVQEAAKALRTFTTYGCAGAGVDTIAIERIRDDFYDVKFRNNESNYGEYSIKSSYMEMIEDYFNDNGTTGFSSLFTGFTTALEEVLKNAGDRSTKTAFVSETTKLTEYFNNLCGNMQNLQKTLNSEVRLRVDNINSIAAEIANLNKQINVVELAGAISNELRDKRDALVDELSQIVNVTTSETPIVDSNNPELETGAYRYVVKIAGGLTLVDGNEYEELEVRARAASEKVNQSDIEGLYDIYWVSNGSKLDCNNASMTGVLSGLLQMRDGNNAEYFHGTATMSDTTLTDVDTAAGTAKVTLTVTADYLTDLNKNNLSSTGVINIDNQLYKYDGWTYTKNADGTVTYTMNVREYDGNTISELQEMADSNKTIVASVGAAIKYQGVPYYMEQMNEWVRIFSEAFNQIMLSGYTDSGETGISMLTGDAITDDTQYALDSDAVKALFYGADWGSETSYSISSSDDSYYLVTAANFAVTDAIRSDADLIATKKNASDGVSQYDNITAVMNMLTDVDVMSFRGGTAGDFLVSLLGDISLNANNADTFSANYTTLQTALNNQRLTISGVDADEEALNLVAYQNTYTLASKAISTFSEVYDQLILKTGV